MSQIRKAKLGSKEDKEKSAAISNEVFPLKNKKEELNMSDYQMKCCANCGSIWRIQKYTDNAWIEADLLTCPLCSEKEEK